MALTITDRIMRSTQALHTASCAPGSEDWSVTWLPGRVLSRDQAIAAMRIAEETHQMPSDCDPGVYDEGFWSRVDALAGVLGMSGPDAVGRAGEPPEDVAEGPGDS